MTWGAYIGPMSMTEGLNPFSKGIVAILKHGDPEGAVVVVTDGDDAFDYETNANVLAAAPDLLDVAENALREFSHILERYDFHDGARHEGASLNDAELMSLDLARGAASAAIAKAGGES